MQTDLITKVYFNEHLTHSCVGMPQGLQALLSSLYEELVSICIKYWHFVAQDALKWLPNTIKLLCHPQPQMYPTVDLNQCAKSG